MSKVKSQIEKIQYIEDLPVFKIQKNSKLDRHVCYEIHKMLGTLLRNNKYPNFFPGPQPVSIERKHFDTLTSQKYMVCEKTDGVRHGLLLTTYAGTKICVLITRALDCYISQVKFAAGYYDGTLLDTELVKHNDGRWNVAVYDCMYVKNKDIKPFDLDQRIDIAKSVVGSILRMSKDPFNVYVKTMHPLSDIRKLFDKTHDYKTDGLVFTPVADPIKIGTHDTLFKWKPREKITIDFLVKKRENGWGLYIQDKGRLLFETIIYPGEVSADWEKILNVDDTIVECEFLDKCVPQRWRPVNTRFDKSHPNNKITFYNTLRNITENIKKNEFLFT